MKTESIRDLQREVLKGDSARAAGEAVLVRFATRLYLLRTSMGLTQEQLAERSGLDQASISDIENGDANPTVRTVGRIASGLGVDAGVLLEPSSMGVRFGATVCLHEAIKWQGTTSHKMTKPAVTGGVRKVAWFVSKGRKGRWMKGKAARNEELVATGS